jgi:hypothetical protein
LLKTGELLDACAGLSIVAFEDGFEAMAVNPRFVQRVAAVRETPDGDFQRYTLDQAETSLA